MLKYIKQRDFEYVNQIPLESLQALSFNKEKGIIIAKWKKQKSTTIDLTIFHKNQNKLTKKEKQVRKNTEKKLKQILGSYPKDACLEFVLD